MKRPLLTSRYLTTKTKHLEGLHQALKSHWVKLALTQTTSSLDSLSKPEPDLLIIDTDTIDEGTVRETLDQVGNLPTIITGTASYIKDLHSIEINKTIDYLNPKEFKSSTLIHTIEHMIERKKLIDELSFHTDHLRELSTRDDLTSLFNKRFIDQLIDTELKKAKRYHHPITALLVGVDDLKSVNEMYGYQIGNQILSEFAILIQQAIREVDIAARYSGDEFLILLPETDVESSITVAERIRSDIHDAKFAAGKLTHSPTASIGVAPCLSTYRSTDEWLDDIRHAMMEAKHAGKDQIRTIDEAQNTKHLLLKENTEIILGLQTQVHQLTEETKNGYFRNILQLIENLPFYKKFIVPHAERVAFFAERLASKVGMQPEEIAAIRRSGLLHDIGKVAIDKRILLKSNNLSQNEFTLLKQHPIIGIQIVGHTLFWKNELAMILHHHERFDGTGYPDKLMGRHIPLGARILSIAESWDTMTSDQAYRPAISLDHAIGEMRRNLGTQFDPELGQTFVKLIEG